MFNNTWNKSKNKSFNKSGLWSVDPDPEGKNYKLQQKKCNLVHKNVGKLSPALWSLNF